MKSSFKNNTFLVNVIISSYNFTISSRVCSLGEGRQRDKITIDATTLSKLYSVLRCNNDDVIQ